MKNEKKIVDNIGNKKPKLRDVAECLKNHYNLKNVSNIFFVYVVEFLKNSIFTHILNQG